MPDDAAAPAPSRVFTPREKLPTIFMFQPTGFEIVAADRLAEWEQLMADNVGLAVDLKQAAGTMTISYVGSPPIHRSDCDQA
jgi:hypothetical protein